MHSNDDNPGRLPVSQPAPASGSLMAGWSIEATLPKPEELDVLAELLPAGTEVFLSTLPHVTLDRQLDAARRIRDLGLEPVPHIAARYFAGRGALEAFVARAAKIAAIRSVLVIGGDLDVPRGLFAGALDVVKGGLLQAHGVREVSFAGYPDGHPAIAEATLNEELDRKLEAASAAGLRCRIVTQFCFRPEPILAWVRAVHARHPTLPIRIGLAGPASVKALVRYAVRCGVGMPKGGLGRKLSMASRIARSASPAGIIRALDAETMVSDPAASDPAASDPAASDPAAGPLAAHFFSFGGLEKTARWALEAGQEIAQSKVARTP
ncbi:MAG: methylenetetrahydrofolate reductase [Alphaproteobacteria bacterium]